MKKFIFLLLLCSVANAHEIKCYSNGHSIYSRQVHKISRADDLWIFIEDSTDKVVMTEMDCVVKIQE